MDSTTPSLPHVTIVMATYNGACFLPEQLQSFLDQTHTPDAIVISDDGSTDDTLQILNRFAADAWDRHGIVVTLLKGPQRRTAWNFLSAMAASPRPTDVMCLADQDDIWMPHKLAHVVSQPEMTLRTPAMLCGPTLEFKEDLGRTRLSRIPQSPRGTFQHALVQNIAGGNTMALNRAAIDLVVAATACIHDVVIHDWWIYQIITGAGGQVRFDYEPLVYYRQHDTNQIGANHGILARFRRFRMLLNGRLRDWTTININALITAFSYLQPIHQEHVHRFQELRNAPFFRRLKLLRQSGLQRHGRLGRLSLYLAVIFHKI